MAGREHEAADRATTDARGALSSLNAKINTSRHRTLDEVAEKAHRILPGKDLSRLLLLRGKGSVAAEIAAKFSPSAHRYRADLSTFSALNLDGLAAQPAVGRPRPAGCKLSQPSDPEAVEAATPHGTGPSPGSIATLRVQGMLDEIVGRSAVNKQDNFAAVRDLFMQFRACSKDDMDAPEELKTLFVNGAMLPQARAPPKSCADRAGFGPIRQISLDACARQVSMDSCAETVYSPGMLRQFSVESRSEVAPSPFGRMRSISSGGLLDELRRKVQSLLNKVCPENIATIAERIASIQVTRLNELEVIIELIFHKALTEPHYTETYADLIFSLKAAFPEFPGSDGGRPMTFRSSLLNICQKEFELFLVPSEEEQPACNAEELELEKTHRKDRMLANMKLIGHLFLRQLLPTKVIATILHELIPCSAGEGLPEEHAMECACELLMSTGHALECIRGGTPVVEQIVGRLQELKRARKPCGKGLCSKRVQFVILDLCDARSAGWTKRTFKSSAKTKDEVRMEQQRQKNAQMRGASVELAEKVVAGQRPQYILSAMGG